MRIRQPSLPTARQEASTEERGEKARRADSREPDAHRWTSFWRTRRSPDEFYPTSPRIREHLFTYVRTGTHVLEVGAGSGRDSAALARAGARVFLLDASAGALELAALTDGEFRGRSLVMGDALSSPFSDATFDVVFHQGLLEHFPDPLPILLENRRILKPGGILLVDVPQTFHPWTVLKKALIAVDRWFAGWETQYSAPGLERIVRRAGFELLATYGDWMNPSLAYRLVRQALMAGGVRLPLEPAQPSWLRHLRSHARDAVLSRRAGLYTAQTIGVVARKPG